MDFNVAYEKWLTAWTDLTGDVIDSLNNCLLVPDNASQKTRNIITQYNENVVAHKQAQWDFYRKCPQALHSLCKGEFLALKQAELEARHEMFTCANTFEPSQFYGQSMKLVDIVRYDQPKCWQTVIDKVNWLRDMGFTVEEKYCAFASNSKLFDNSWSAYYIYANVNDVRKFLYASYLYEIQDIKLLELIYPPMLPVDNTHKAIYTDKVDI